MTCNSNSATSVPADMIARTGTLKPNELLYTLRQVLCTNKCEKPEGLPDGVGWAKGQKGTDDCEVAIAITGGVEAVGPPRHARDWVQAGSHTVFCSTCVVTRSLGMTSGSNAGIRRKISSTSVSRMVPTRGGSMAPTNIRYRTARQDVSVEGTDGVPLH